MDRYLIGKEIEELNFGKQHYIEQAGLIKSCKKLWKKHKTEILIGVGVTALVVTVVVVSVSTAGTGSVGAATAGGAAVGALKNKKKEKKKKIVASHEPTPSQKSLSPMLEKNYSSFDPLRPKLDEARIYPTDEIIPLIKFNF